MKDIPPHRFGRILLLGSLLALQPGPCLSQSARPQDDAADYDCGAMALHALLAIEGRPTAIEAVQSRLPPQTRAGYSMAELREAARAFGLPLTGVKLPATDRSPDRPALVFLRQGDHGHFLVIRPVGHSGKLIQIIDVSGDPIVMDAADLYASRPWTGLALVPRRRNWAMPIAASLLAGCTAICGLYLVGRLRRPKNGSLAANLT